MIAWFYGLNSMGLNRPGIHNAVQSGVDNVRKLRVTMLS